MVVGETLVVVSVVVMELVVDSWEWVFIVGQRG